MIMVVATIACHRCASCISSCGSKSVSKPMTGKIVLIPSNVDANIGNSNGNNYERPDIEIEAPSTTVIQKISF